MVSPVTYLSRVRINPRRSAAQTLLANPRALRGAVLHAIPEDPLAERILWRLDSDNPFRPHLLVLTRTKPDWSHLIETAGWPDADGEHARIADYRPLLERIRPGDHYAFRLTANPIQNTSTPDKATANQTAYTASGGRRSFRIGHRTASAQLGWFLKRTPNWGFSVPRAEGDPAAPGITQIPHTAEPETTTAHDIRIIARNRVAFGKKKHNRQAGTVTLHTATYEGRLEVTDPERLTTALLNGIGPAKAYGCGLLTLAPLQRQ
ncbi:CRISPR-associated endoribonuclease Cse3 [Nocardia farcinica]|nr:CRISPR-associated endoribonuclease Cse3 [Nocardia farcinica]